MDVEDTPVGRGIIGDRGVSAQRRPTMHEESATHTQKQGIHRAHLVAENTMGCKMAATLEVDRAKLACHE